MAGMKETPVGGEGDLPRISTSNVGGRGACSLPNLPEQVYSLWPLNGQKIREPKCRGGGGRVSSRKASDWKERGGEQGLRPRLLLPVYTLKREKGKTEKRKFRKIRKGRSETGTSPQFSSG